MKICSIESCGKGGRIRRGMCVMHYRRWQRHGDPQRIVHYSDPADAFLARTEPIVGDPGCLIWTGALDGSGYGCMRIDGRSYSAHRWAYEQEHGPIPAGMVIDHTCWERSCVAVDHLRLATLAQNRQNLSGAQSGRMHDLPRGVYRHGRGYQVEVGHNGQRHHLGTFPTIAEASRAAQIKRAILFGEFAGAA